jgi:small subunit ribosomal protein S24
MRAAKTSGRFKVSRKHDNPLTYEQAFKPHEIAHIKFWNSMNTSNLPDFGLRQGRTLTEDIFIRRFLTCTWHNLFVSEILIKRQANFIRIAGIVQQSIMPRKMYFLLGYSEELLSHWLQCPVKLELQTVDNKKDVIFKYV